MGTIPEPEQPERFMTAEELRAWVEGATRTVVAGSPVGAVRRILLYAIIGIALTVNVLAPLGLIAVILLATTDAYR